MIVVLRRAATAVLVAVLAAAPKAATAQIAESEYAARRAAFTASLGDGVYLILGAPDPRQDYEPWWQAPNFRYLTGFLEPGASLIIVRKDGKDAGMLFVPPRDPAQEVWTGERLGVEGVRRSRPTLEGRAVGTLRTVLDSVLKAGAALYVVADLSRGGGADVPGNRAPRTPDDQFLDGVKERNRETKLTDASRNVMQLRAKKSAAELALLKTAAQISAKAHEEVLHAIAPGMNEFEIQALAEYTFRRNGGDRPGYGSIVGSGPNSTTLHYNRDDRFMRSGEVLNMDMATYYGGYSADITRTVPVSGKFSAEQRAIYQVVLDAQMAAERQVKPGNASRAMNDSATAALRAGLTRLGLLESADATYEAAGGRRVSQLSLFYMHGLGHPIGLEVHDIDTYAGGSFSPGNVFSIEPGVYVRANTLDLVPDVAANKAYREKLAAMLPKYVNIGVRIEDNYIVTAGGFERISADAPREPDAIERAMAQRRGPAARDSAMVEAYRRIRP
ncbi:MAG: M24 family metallopeptidase [Gemmatimonadetes bacterium]|nr:M24 family metallopeptidase [Gemmatimonadota bacterium]